MTVKVKVKVSRVGVNRMVRADFMQDEMVRRAELVRIAAEMNPPVVTGQYAYGTIEPGGFDVTPHRSRTGAGARVTNLAPHGYWVERGNSLGAPAQHIMRDALRAATARG
ncbi:hypothetical protein BDK92_7254 [Micromonospora pisi]|uniref:Minor capsid protein n=1 Tax=Micromonospora pisi TaxID=589240 RepID=A0A495JWZ0_9ACTN|nr:hypothetical protein [Micromonospora pisi]RKR92774.1 hypothetical protein BDK92_7254 [Micromonospora pisi]